ncbi:FAD-dependent oxidoreductase [Undibacterium sp. SXout7W]|uniref:FAD-dependent oxidoreductase n=1 Tax=Undibacterium sp. SXout7W TaxID=3413049 RepID=UPI003BF13ACA
MKPVAIIGSGLAGYTVAREFRKLDKTTPLLIITGDDGAFYSKPMLSNAYAQGKAADQLINQSAEQMAAQLNANILTTMQVTGIYVHNKTVQTHAGEFEYDKLVLAVGAQPIRLPLTGDAAEQVVSVNTLADYAVFRGKIRQAGNNAHITILGAGLIGCEFADDLASAGYAVTLIDPGSLPLASLAPHAISLGLQTALQGKGVTLKMQTTAASIDHHEQKIRISLSSGKYFDTDVVLSAVGLRADISLAKAAGLATDRAILVDQFGLSSDNHIFAVGDCAQYTMSDGSYQALPYVAPIMTAARAIAQSLTGNPSVIELKPSAVLVKTPSYPIALIPAPVNARSQGTWKTEQQSSVTTSRFFDENQVLRGFALAPQDNKQRNALLAALGKHESDLELQPLTPSFIAAV